MSFFECIYYFHSFNRYLLLAVLVVVIINSLNKFFRKKSFDKSDNVLVVVSLASAHLQWLMGIYLYFTSALVVFNKNTMKDAILRYWTVEHAFMMLIAIVFITIGRVLAKRSSRKIASGLENVKIFTPHKTVFVFNSLALLVITISLLGMP